MHELAKANGAIGGDISGEDNEGFLMLYCEDNKPRLRKVMRQAGLRELSFRFDFEGSKVVFDIVLRDKRLAHIHRLERNGNGNRYLPKTIGVVCSSSAGLP